MRGERIFRTLIEQEQPRPTRRGRNPAHLAQRDQCLLARYFYHGFHKGRCLEDILNLLAMEFFLTRERIIRIVQANADTVKDLKAQKVTIYRLQHQWPHYKW